MEGKITNPTKTRILYIGVIPPEVGGQEAGGIATHVWELAREAHKRGYEVYILAHTVSSFSKDGINVIAPSQESKLLKGVHILSQWLKVDKKRICSLSVLTLKEKIGALYQARYLQQILESIKPDLIHIHSFLNRSPLSLGILNNCPPIVITDHGIGVTYEYGLQELFRIKDTNCFIKTVKEIAKRANYIIADSEFAKALLKKNFSLPNTPKMKAILIPLDISKIPLLNKPETKRELNLAGKKVILFSGASHAIKRKGLDILLKAFDINDYLKKECKLLVVTNGEAISFAQDFVKENNIDGLILEHQSWEMMVKYYNAADVFVMPSRKEAFGLVYTEAFSAGTPVVGFYKSIKEFESLLGIYIGEGFDPWKEDEIMLAEKIIKVLNTEFDRELLRKKAMENLSWEAKFDEFDSIYREVTVNPR